MPFHAALIERATFMRARIIDGMKMPLDIEHRNGTLIHLDDFDLARRNVLNLGHTLKPFHKRFQLPFFLLHPKRKLQFHPGRNPRAFRVPRLRLDQIPNRLRRRTVEWTRILGARLHLL